MGKTCPTCNISYEDGSVFCPADGTTLRSLNADQDDLIGTVIADRYLLTEKLGEGGMGRVYLARHVRVPRQAAIKVLRNIHGNDYDAIAAFNREANNAAKMGNHPHVAEVYDFGETADGLVYLAMEYVDGEPLSRLLERERVLTPRRAAEITRQVAEALTVAHELPNPVIHRDLKPDNIMLARNRDGSDCVKVVDFGIAKAITGETQKLTSPGFAVGTPKYMSPEQLTAADALDARTDIYSLGLIAFQMLTGRLPFPSASAEEESTLQWAIGRLVTPAVPLARANGDVRWPAKLEGVFGRVLARSPDDRYGSAEAFARDLVQAVDELDRPGAVQPTTRPAVVAAERRTVPSRTALVAGGFGVVLALVVITLAMRGKLWTQNSTELAGAAVPAAAPVVPPVAPPRTDSSRYTATAGGDLAAPGGGSGTNADTLGTAPDAGRRPTDRGSIPAKESLTASNARPQGGLPDTASVIATRDDPVDVRSAARAALDNIDNALSGQTTPTADQAVRMLDTLQRIRPSLGRSDDLRAQFFAAELLLVVGQTAEACKLLRAVERDGAGTEMGRIAQKYLNPPPELRQLNCPE